MNSTSLLNLMTVGWKQHLNVMIPPARQTHTPTKVLPVLGYVVQSKSAFAWAIS
jgi:hypothetical protein